MISIGGLPVPRAARPPIDGLYAWLRRAHPELVTAFAILGVQPLSRTDTSVTRWFDRLPVIRDIAGSLRRVRRRLTGPPAGMKPANLNFE